MLQCVLICITALLIHYQIPYWQKRITSADFLLTLDEYDNVFQVASSFFSENSHKSLVILETHPTSHIFQGNNLQEYKFLQSEWTNFTPLSMTFIQVDTGLFVVKQKAETPRPDLNPVNRNIKLKQFEDIK